MNARRIVVAAALVAATMTPVGPAARVVGLGASASAQERAAIDRAEALVYRARFEDAHEALGAVLADAGLDAATAARAHRLLAAVDGVLGRADDARGHALAAVALDPAASAPEGMSSSARWFDEARRRLSGRRATITIRRRGVGASARVTARVEPYVEGLVDRVELRCGDGRAPVDGPARAAVQTDAPSVAGTTRCTATARTAAGATLLRVTRAFGPSSATHARPPVERAAPSVWPWIAVGAGIAAVAVTTIVIVVVASPDADTEVGPPVLVGWP